MTSEFTWRVMEKGMQMLELGQRKIKNQIKGGSGKRSRVETKFHAARRENRNCGEAALMIRVSMLCAVGRMRLLVFSSSK